MSGSRRRFIAGAVCPACRAVDRLTLEVDGEGTQRRLCVACGFSDTSTDSGTGSIPRGKHEMPAASRESAPAKVVRILSPDSDNNSND